jgi:hypothetical protein
LVLHFYTAKLRIELLQTKAAHVRFLLAMKVILIFLLVVSIGVSGQTLNDIFLALPDGSIGATVDERLVLLNNYNQQKNGPENGVGPTHVYIKEFDFKNNFLVLAGDYPGATTLKYWTRGNTEFVVGLETRTCPLECDSHLRFWTMKNNLLTEIERDDLIPAIGFKDFFNVPKMVGDSQDVNAYETKFNASHLIYTLPKFGSTVVIKSQFHLQQLDEILINYNRGSRIEIVWHNGSFRKGKQLK